MNQNIKKFEGRMLNVKRAIVSVSDKAGIVGFAMTLHELGIEMLSTGGTAKILKEAGIPVKEVSDYTGFPEILDGRVKTLHPKVHGGLLAKRDNSEHMKAIDDYGIVTIDMVVVTLYPFQKTISKPGVTFDEAIENIDIGGPAMLRAAAKNFASVAVIMDPSDYPAVKDELITFGGISYETRVRLAQKVFNNTSQYDSIISDFLKDSI